MNDLDTIYLLLVQLHALGETKSNIYRQALDRLKLRKHQGLERLEPPMGALIQYQMAQAKAAYPDGAKVRSEGSGRPFDGVEGNVEGVRLVAGEVMVRVFFAEFNSIYCKPSELVKLL